MNKLTEIFSFIKDNLNGEYTRAFLIAAVALMLYNFFWYYWAFYRAYFINRI